MATQLRKLNGKSLQFLLSEDEERVLKIIYYQAKAKLVTKSGNYYTENVLFTNRIGEELTGFCGVKLTRILQRLAALKFIKVTYARDRLNTYRRYRYVHMNCKAFEDKYYWAN